MLLSIVRGVLYIDFQKKSSLFGIFFRFRPRVLFSVPTDPVTIVLFSALLPD